jgi:formylglycine-generating enzyme required for sulfatase activity
MVSFLSMCADRMETRNLTIMFTDIKGFTARTSDSTRRGLLDLLTRHNELVLPIALEMGGRLVKTIGDAFLLVFESPTNSALAGMKIQKRLKEYNESVADDEKIEIRIAINCGEVALQGNDVFGEAVNIASRIEGIAEPGEIYFTESVYLAMNKKEVPSVEVGWRQLKGIPEKVRVYKVKKASTPKTGRTKTIKLGSGIEFEMEWIPPGEFKMGSPAGELNRFDAEGPVHKVKIASGFFMGRFVVTQGEWKAVLGNNPSSFKKGDDYPVEQVTWDDCQAFIKKVNERVNEKEKGEGKFRLPTEAEWEHACRAKITTRYYWGDSDHESVMDEHCWYDRNSENSTHPVGEKKPNAWGLYDMLGNVWEWCEDDWHNNYSGAPVSGDAWLDGLPEKRGLRRVFRGGCWFYSARCCRSAYRGWNMPDYRDDDLGFRLVFVPSRSGR